MKLALISILAGSAAAFAPAPATATRTFVAQNAALDDLKSIAEKSNPVLKRSQSQYPQSLDTHHHSLMAINTESINDCKSKPLTKKIIDGLKVAPAVASLPLYGMAFALVGPKTVWRFSKWIYGQTNPSDDVLTSHFDRVSAYLYSGKEIASQKLLSYKIHPLFAGLSMISTALLAFVDRAIISNAMTYQRLLLLNAVFCFVSAVAAFPISKIMIDNLHAKKWIIIQGKLSMLYAMLSLCPGTLGRVMIHLNWAICQSTANNVCYHIIPGYSSAQVYQETYQATEWICRHGC